MKRTSVILATAVCVAIAAFAAVAQTDAPKAEPPAAAPVDIEKTSYAIGWQMGTSVKRAPVQLNQEAMVKGLTEAMQGKEPTMSEDEMKQVMMSFQKEMAAKAQEANKKKAEENSAAGKAFLEENGKKEGVVTLPSGLQYKVLQEGKADGKAPVATDRVKVNYRGTLITGEEFDSSFKRGTPAEFQVNKVIKGWTEALQLMKEGAKWEVYIPSDLAYGAMGNPKIGPNQVLIFEVELLEVLPSVTVENQGAAPAQPQITIQPSEPAK